MNRKTNKKVLRGKLARAKQATARCHADVVEKDGPRSSITYKDKQDAPTWYKGQESGSGHGEEKRNVQNVSGGR